MKVYIVGAGPGAADLITLRGARVLERCPVVLYAGSLVPPELLDHVQDGARVIDTASMHLDEIMAEFERAQSLDLDVARVHSGDPSLYGATGEQMRRLEALGIEYEIVPGVPAYAAAAAALKRELTLPGVSQTVVLTRTATLSSAMPNAEDLDTLGRSGATLAIHLSVRIIDSVCEALLPHYGADCPVAVLVRASWPDEQVFEGTLSTIAATVKAARIRRTALIVVGRVLDPGAFEDSRLYASDHYHLLRTKKQAQAKLARQEADAPVAGAHTP